MIKQASIGLEIFLDTGQLGTEDIACEISEYG
jgi:hypothetical protein